MVFAHDTEVALQAAVTLANTALEPGHADDGRASSTLWYARFEYTGRRDRDAAELDAVRGVRRGLRELLTADRDDAVAMVNEMLADARAVPQLVRHERVRLAPARGRPRRAAAQPDRRRDRDGDDRRDARRRDVAARRLRGRRLRRRRARPVPQPVPALLQTTCGNRNAVAAYRARQSGDD